MARSVRRRRRREDLATAIRLERADQAGAFHLLDHACGAVVADLEAALHARDRRAAGLGDDAHGLIVQGVLLAAALAADLARQCISVPLALAQDVLDVLRCLRGLLEEL